jgi:hypothetical protein
MFTDERNYFLNNKNEKYQKEVDDFLYQTEILDKKISKEKTKLIYCNQRKFELNVTKKVEV